MAKKKKKKTGAAGAALVPVAAAEKKKPYKKNPQENHPAVGLLTHEYQDQNQSDPNEPAGVCGLCGFDEEFHALTVDDYTGPGRDGSWLERQKAHEAGEEFSDRE